MSIEEPCDGVFKGSTSTVCKLAVCACVGVVLSLTSLAETTLRDEWPLCLAGGAALGLIAGSFLVLRDAVRNWKPGRSGSAGALQSAPVQGLQERPGCIVWIGMILAAVSLLGGAIMLVVKLVQLARRVL